jgi:hypothetical protein
VPPRVPRAAFPEQPRRRRPRPAAGAVHRRDRTAARPARLPAPGHQRPDHALDEPRQPPAAHHIPADPRMPIQPNPPDRDQQAKPPAARTQHPAVSQTTLPRARRPPQPRHMSADRPANSARHGRPPKSQPKSGHHRPRLSGRILRIPVQRTASSQPSAGPDRAERNRQRSRPASLRRNSPESPASQHPRHSKPLPLKLSHPRTASFLAYPWLRSNESTSMASSLYR